MANVTGRFYFKQTSNGNLIGEFSNHQSPDIYTESADGYIGKYYSTWREVRTPRFADLEISKTGSTKKFSLIWNVTGGEKYTGEGMLCGDILIGDYESVP
jgi:hypothetical protein